MDDLAPIRRFVRDAADLLDLRVLEADLALATSELVANAMQREAGDVEVTVSVTAAGNLRLEVRDRGGGEPVLQRTPAPGAIGQRGLLIVDALTVAWGVEPRPPGKVVWCELAPLPSETSSAAARRPERSERSSAEAG
ncbi:MAG: protein phosphatase [Acidimicrobiales bacterium]|nr:protein phosphatase [Acidimicrobiales bacterium]